MATHRTKPPSLKNVEVATSYNDLKRVLRDANYKFIELPHRSNLANIKTKLFKDRFYNGKTKIDVPKRLDRYRQIYQTKENYERYRRLIRQFCTESKTLCQDKDMYLFANIYNERANIFNFILTRFQGMSSIFGVLNDLATMVLYKDPFDINVRKEAARIFYYRTSQQHQHQNAKHGNNHITDEEKKTFISFPKLVAYRDSLEPTFTSIQNYGSSVRTSSRSKRTTGNYNDVRLKPNTNKEFRQHMIYLKLCVNTYIPPLRRQFKDMIYEEDDTKAVNTKTEQNYLHKNTETGIYSIILNHDKVESKRGQEVLTLNREEPYLQSSEMTKVFNHSFKIFPRKYVFPKWQSVKGNPDVVGNEPMEQGVFDSLIDFDGKNPKQNTLRYAHHTYFVSDVRPQLTNNQKEDMASFSRHSLATANRVYNKIHMDHDMDTKVDIHKARTFNNDEDILKRINELVDAKMKLIYNTMDKKETKLKELSQEKKAKIKAYNKKYFSKSNYGSIRQSDNRYLNYLNKGNIKQPKQTVLDKHGVHKVGDRYEFTDVKLQERKQNKNSANKNPNKNSAINNIDMKQQNQSGTGTGAATGCKQVLLDVGKLMAGVVKKVATKQANKVVDIENMIQYNAELDKKDKELDRKASTLPVLLVSKKKHKPSSSPWIQHVRNYMNEHNISYKQAMKDSKSTYKKVERKKTERTNTSSSSPWIQHVRNYMNEHNISYKQAMKDSKSTYKKVDGKKPESKTTERNTGVYVQNMLTQNEHLKLFQNAHKGGQMGKRDIRAQATGTYIKPTDSSNTIRKKLMKYAMSLRGMKKRWTSYKGQDKKHAKTILDIINEIYPNIVKIYQAGQKVGYTTIDPSQPKIPKPKKHKTREKKKEPKPKTATIKNELLSLINQYGKIQLKKENIARKDMLAGNHVRLMLQNFTVNGEPVDMIMLTFDDKHNGFGVKMKQRVGRFFKNYSEGYFIYL
jgi:hypothetical protein